MIYEIDTLFDCIITVIVLDNEKKIIESKEIQHEYNDIYVANSKSGLISKIKKDTEEFLESNKSSGWTNRFLQVDNWSYIEIDVDFLKNPNEYEYEDECNRMHQIIKRAYRHCTKDGLETEIYSSYFNVYYNNFKYRVEKYSSCFIRIDKIITECFPYYAEVTYTEYANEVSAIIRNFDLWIKKK